MSESNIPETIENGKKGVALLDKIFELTVNGIPLVSEPVDELARSYLSKAKSPDAAIEKFIRNQKAKCFTTGFLTGLGGFITLPVTLPTDLASSLYIEMRMIATIATIRGYNIQDDQVKTLVYACMAGNVTLDIFKQVGIKTAETVAIKKLLPKLSREVIVKINQKVGFRLITRAGSKGLINLTKWVPIFGGIVGGGWNWAEVAVVAKLAKKIFNENR